MKRVSAVTVPLVLMLACSHEPVHEAANSSPAAKLPDIEEQVRLRSVTTPLGPGEIVDGMGTVWTYVRDIEIAKARDGFTHILSDSSEEPTAPLPENTEEEVAKALRVMRVFDGKLYIVRDLQLEKARQIIAMRAAGQNPSTEPNEGWGGPSTQPVSPQNGLSTKYVVGDVGVWEPEYSAYDSRYHWTPNTDYPQRATGKLYFHDIYGNTSWCTAFFVAARTIVFAAHCAFDRNATLVAAQYYVMDGFEPGRDGTVALNGPSAVPWGTWAVSPPAISSNYIYELPGNELGYDWACANVTIPAGYTGSPGWYGISIPAYNNTWTHGAIPGYAADEPQYLLPGETRGSEPFQGFGLVTNLVSNRYQHSIDVIVGDDGGPTFFDQVSTTSAIGIVTASYYANNGNTWNESVAFNSSNYAAIQSACGL